MKRKTKQRKPEFKRKEKRKKVSKTLKTGRQK